MDNGIEEILQKSDPVIFHFGNYFLLFQQEKDPPTIQLNGYVFTQNGDKLERSRPNRFFEITNPDLVLLLDHSLNIHSLDSLEELYSPFFGELTRNGGGKFVFEVGTFLDIIQEYKDELINLANEHKAIEYLKLKSRRDRFLSRLK